MTDLRIQAPFYESREGIIHPLRPILDLIAGRWFAGLVSFSGLAIRLGPFGHPCAAMIALRLEAAARGLRTSWSAYADRPVSRATLRADKRRGSTWLGPQVGALERHAKIWAAKKASAKKARERKRCASH